MMLDNKNEQKWPLTEKKFLKRTNSQGSFLLFSRLRADFLRLEPDKKERAARSRPNIFIISQLELTVNI